MTREVIVNNISITYNLQRKNVKNINLRIKPDKTIMVSANKSISAEYLDDFVKRKHKFILNAFKKYEASENRIQKPNFTKYEFLSFVNECFNKTYILFSDKIKEKPTLKIKPLKSKWGSCNYKKYIITINYNLIYCDKKHIEYVMIHEFSHFIIQNHSKTFYDVVKNYCADYKSIDKELNKISLNHITQNK